MDILSHGLWAGAAAKAANLKKERRINVWLAAFWGVFPDLFAFTIPFVWLFGNVLFGNIDLSDIHRPSQPEPETKLLFGNGDMRQAQSAIAYTASMFYNLSHSAVVFLLIFGLIIWARKILKKENCVPWEMCGWLFHILLDVPTHSYAFYPTPVFWPLAGWKFNGYSWGNLWFVIVDYAVITAVYSALWFLNKRRLLHKN